MNATKSKIILGVVSAIAVIALGITAIVFVPASFFSYSDAAIRINKGDSLNTVAQTLSDSGLIRSKIAFKTYALLSGQSRNLKAGLYKVSSKMSIAQLVRIFSGGFSESEDVVVTIPEGSNINDIDVIFAKSGLTKRTDLLKSEYVNQEGYLFPDTYNFLPGILPEEIIKKMRDNFTGRTEKLFHWSLMEFEKNPYKDVLIVASILEKEVQTAEDMRLVAGVIEKRMSLGMRLEIDATSAYGECYKSFVNGINCEVSEVNIIKAITATSPYNTYRISGLPVGPISNPGMVAIEAALNPTASDYLFYLTDKDGVVYYAKNLAEHNRNRAKYLNK